MANGITTAFWSVTINNYDERDLAIVQNGYPDYCREIVHTLEKGEEGTPHIQAWVKLQRQQRMSFIRKLFPGGHYRPLTSDEYIQNTKAYCQKLDSTAQSSAVHKFNDPLKTLEPVVKIVVLKMKDLLDEKYGNDNWEYAEQERKYRLYAERQLVAEDYRYAKVFVSATYEKMWKLFGAQMCQNILTHTHTHTQPEENISRVDIPTTDGEAAGRESDAGYEDGGSEGCEDDEGDEECSGSETEGYDSGGSSSDCSEDA